MRLCTYSPSDDTKRLGALLTPTSILDVNKTALHLGIDLPESLSLGELVRESGQTWAAVRSVVSLAQASDLPSGYAIHIDEATFSYPFRPRSNIVKAGGNARLGDGVPRVDAVQQLRYHTKSPAACAAPGSVISWRRSLTSQVYIEPQLVIVVGSPLYFASPSEAMASVVGYSVGLDFRAWDLMQMHGQWPKAISLDGFFPWGPFLVTPDEVANADALEIRLTINGQRIMNDSTENVLLSIGEFLSEISSGMSIRAGDAFMLGVPEAVGLDSADYRWCQDGDLVSGHIGDIGDIDVTIGISE